MDTPALPIDPELCVLPDGNEPVKASELNLLIRRVSRYHLLPMKIQLAETDKTLNEHIKSCALNQAKIMGGIRVLTWLVSSGLGLFLLTALAKFVGWM